jgi:hypothetical protein
MATCATVRAPLRQLRDAAMTGHLCLPIHFLLARLLLASLSTMSTSGEVTTRWSGRARTAP